MWSLGAKDLADFLTKFKLWTMKDIAQQIRCARLVMEGDGDMFTHSQPQQIYDALKSPKTFVKFSSEDGAENHCQSGALAYKDEVVYNWLDEILKRECPGFR